MNLKKSAKGRLIPVVILCIVIASTGFLCFFHDPSQKGQYCNHILHWKKCDGQLVRIFGKVPAFVMQHPSYLSDNHNIKRQHQSYIDTAFRKQIVLLSEERITCQNKLTVTGILETNVGPCDPDSPGKNMYCGSKIHVNQWECR
jgi:hypothetical protein